MKLKTEIFLSRTNLRKYIKSSFKNLKINTVLHWHLVSFKFGKSVPNNATVVSGCYLIIDFFFTNVFKRGVIEFKKTQLTSQRSEMVSLGPKFMGPKEFVGDFLKGFTRKKTRMAERLHSMKNSVKLLR